MSFTVKQIFDNYEDYRASFKKKWLPLIYTKNDRLYGIWSAGADYRNINAHPGAYSRDEWERLEALFPYSERGTHLHLFSGGVRPGDYWRVDEKGVKGKKHRTRDIVGRFPECTAHLPDAMFDMIFADPPWSKVYARELYGVEPLEYKKSMGECHRLLKSGGWLVWKDANSPPRSNKMFRYAGFCAVDPSAGKMDRSFRFFQKI